MKDFFTFLKWIGKRSALGNLLPGIVVTWLFLPSIKSMLDQTGIQGRGLVPESETARWVGFFIVAWIVGSILMLVGSLLDKPVYDWFFKRIVKRGKNDLLESAKVTIHRDLPGKTSWEDFSYFDYCLTYVTTHGPERGVEEINEYIGNSKLFRSLAVTLIGVCAAFILISQSRFAIAVLFVSLLSLWVFCANRWNSTQRVYEFYIIARVGKDEKHTT
jgi:hypothetical protein